MASRARRRTRRWSERDSTSLIILCVSFGAAWCPRGDGGPACPSLVAKARRVAAVSIFLEVAGAAAAPLGDGEAGTAWISAASRQRSLWRQTAERRDVVAAARVERSNRVHPVGG